MATNTDLNLGIREECGALGMRNFENTGLVQYKSNKDRLEFMSTTLGGVLKYNVGVTLPFDVGGTHYSSAALGVLELYWDQGWILPLV